MKRIHLAFMFVVLVIAVATAACGSSSTTAPSSPGGTTTTPATPTTFTLSGTISSAAGGGIAGATVTIGDGPNLGKSATTDSSGAYTLASLTSGGFTVTISAGGFVQTAKPVTLTSNATLSVALLPSALYTVNGNGNNVLTIPSYVTKLHIVGTYNGSSTNFIIWFGPTNVDCSNSINGNCNLVVNDLLGTSWSKTTSDGVYLTGGQPQLQVVKSTGVAWTVTESR